MTTFSCITTSKSRLHHLMRSLPAMRSAGFDEVIVVDFDCPQSTSDWCKRTHPEVKVVEVDNQMFYSGAKARNNGAEHASSNWLCFVDADIVLSSRFVTWLRKNVRKGNFYAFDYVGQPRPKRKIVKSAAGLVVCEQAAFKAVDGYDELFAGWGYEDVDFLLKLRHAGYRGKALPVDLIDVCIAHGNEDRMRHHEAKNKQISNLQNKFYSSAKMKLVKDFGLPTELPKSIRENLYRAVSDVARKWNPSDLKSIQSVELDVPAGIEVLPKYEARSVSLSKEAVARRFVVEAAFEKKLRRCLFSGLPALLRNMTLGLR